MNGKTSIEAPKGCCPHKDQAIIDVLKQLKGAEGMLQKILKERK